MEQVGHSKWHGDNPEGTYDASRPFRKGFAILSDGRGEYKSCDMTYRRFLACAKLIKRGERIWDAITETEPLDWLRRVLDDKLNISYEWWE